MEVGEVSRGIFLIGIASRIGGGRGLLYGGIEMAEGITKKRVVVKS